MPDFDQTNRGTLSPNVRKTTEKHPDFKGQLNVDGKECWLSAWRRTGAKGEFMSLQIEPKEDRPTAPPATPAPAAAGMDEKPPF